MSPIPSTTFQTLIKTPSPTPLQQQIQFSLNNKENNYDTIINSTELKKLSMPPPPPTESPHQEPAPRKRRRKREDPQSCFANSEVSFFFQNSNFQYFLILLT